MISVDWANEEETVAIWQFRKEWSAEQFYDAGNYGFDMISAKPYPVHVILDFSYSRHSPTNIMVLFSNLFRNFPPNTEQFVILAKTSYWERLISAVLAGIRIDIPIRFTSDVDETYSLVGLNEGKV